MNMKMRLLTGTLFMLTASTAFSSELVVCTEASPESLNPQFTTSNTSYDVASQIYNRLVELERGGTLLQPGLAESWSSSEDGMEWVFRLRENVKWHSNEEFQPSRNLNADDVIYTFTRMSDTNHPMHEAGGRAYPYYTSFIEPYVERVEKIDEYTVRFVMKEERQSLPSTLSAEPMSILSLEYSENMLEAGAPEKTATSPIGTGPFRFVDYRRDAYVRFEANPDHWAVKAGLDDRTAKVEKLVFAITPDPTVRVAKLRTGECDIVRYATPNDLPLIEADDNLEIATSTAANFGYVAINNMKEPFTDKRVREAMIHAIDREAIIETVYGRTGRVPNALIPPILWGHHEGLVARSHDPERARSLLAEAGLSDGFSTTMWALPVTRGYLPDGRRAAEMIQADLGDVGINVEILTFEWGEHLQRSRTGDHELAMIGSSWDYPDPGQIPTVSFTCDRIENGPNRARWCNPEFDAAFHAGNRAHDVEERIEHYRRGQEIFHEDAPVIGLGNGLVSDPIRNRVQDYKVHVFGGQPYFGVSVVD